MSRHYETWPALLTYEITAQLTWSTSVTGIGRTVADARRDLMEAALARLSDRHLERLQWALAPELKPDDRR